MVCDLTSRSLFEIPERWFTTAEWAQEFLSPDGELKTRLHGLLHIAAEWRRTCLLPLHQGYIEERCWLGDRVLWCPSANGSLRLAKKGRWVVLGTPRNLRTSFSGISSSLWSWRARNSLRDFRDAGTDIRGEISGCLRIAWSANRRKQDAFFK